MTDLTMWEKAAVAVLTLHIQEPMKEGDIIGPYCSHCISPIDGGPELWPCMTTKAVIDAAGFWLDKTPPVRGRA